MGRPRLGDERKGVVTISIDMSLWDAYGAAVGNRSEGITSLISAFLKSQNNGNSRLDDIKKQIRELEMSAVDVQIQAKQDQIARLKAECIKYMKFYIDKKCTRFTCSNEKQNELISQAAMLGVKLRELLAYEIEHGTERHQGCHFNELKSAQAYDLKEGAQPDQPAA